MIEDGVAPDPDTASAAGPLADLRVLDLSTVLAGPGCARHLADFGADVIKIERPGGGDTARNLGWRDTDGETFFFKGANRNKRFIQLDLGSDAGRRNLLRLVEQSDVLVENMRPGKLEALGLGPAVLHGHRPSLVIVRVTAFGQDGPYAHRPGFATLAEAMSGFAALNGDADGAPTLPPVALTDEVTGLAAAFATMVAVHSGVGQVVDASLIESMIQLMGPLPSLWMKAGQHQPRLGSGLPYSIPRGTYRTADEQWIAISTSADSVAARIMELVGLGNDPRVATVTDRMEHRQLVEDRVAAWVSERTASEALAAIEAADGAASQVYDMDALTSDPHIVARRSFVDVDGYPMATVIARLSATPGAVRRAGQPIAADAAAVWNEFGLEPPD
jgi:crotonobetainyl-CoA:carnitine CoA-transferase CaiB-like acyl-CoA transferase